MKWLDQTHGRNFELIRHFLGTLFDSEMFSSRGNWGSVAVGAFALAVPAGMLMLSTKPGRVSPIALELSALTLLEAICGIVALLAWQSLFPTRRDYLALAALPVRPRQIFTARVVCVLLLAGAVTGTLSLSMGRTPAAVLGCLFVFFAIVSLQGILIHTLSPHRFAQWSTWVQGALLAAFVLAGLYSWFIRAWLPADLARLPGLGRWAPPVWFLGLQQKMKGSRDPFFLAMAARAAMAAAWSIAAAAAVYLAAYGRYRQLLLEAQDMSHAPTLRSWSLLGLLTRDPRRQAILQFMAKVLARSRVQRLVLMAYAGAGVALMLNSVLIAGRSAPVLPFVALYWPVGFSLVMIAGIRHAFAMPVELPANWIFRLTESQGRRQWMSAVERFVVACIIAPIHLLNLPVAAAALGWPVAVRMTLLQALVSLAVFDIMFYSWQQLPFTCSYTPGRDSLISSLGGWLLVMCLVVPLVARIVAGLSQMTEIFLLCFTLFTALWLGARKRRRDGWGEAKLLYEDPGEAVADLGIKDLAWRNPPLSVPSAPSPAIAAAPERPVAAGLRVYRALAAAFPYEFRNAWGDEVLGAAEDAIDSVWRRHGLAGLLRLLADIAIRVPAEHFAELGHDIRYGLRMLCASPGFTAVALVSLTLGIGVATSAFSEMNGFILRDVPGIAGPDSLVLPQELISYPAYQRYAARGDLFANTLAYMAPVPFGVRSGGRTRRIFGHLVTPSYFATLGVRPFLGRDFAPGAQAPAAIVSFGFWRDQLGSDRSAIGRMLEVNGRAVEIVGVGPRDFRGASPMVYQADIWIPLTVEAALAPELAGNPLERYDAKLLHVVGRLRPGVGAGQAESALDAIARRLETENADPDRGRGGRRITLLPGGKLLPVPRHDLPFLTGFFTILGGMILLIAGSNVANIMLARAADRRREIAVRLALGASRARLVRQLMTECLLLAGASGVLGLLMTTWLMQAASRMKMPNAMPITLSLQPDARVLLFTLALTAGTAVAIGIAPALRATRTDLTPALKEGGGVRLHRLRRLSLRNLLVVAQIGGSLMLLLITGFLVVGHRRIAGAEVGFDPRHLYLTSVDPLRDGYPAAECPAFFRRFLERVRAQPAVTAASLADTTPMQMIGRPAMNYLVDGRTIHGARKSLVEPDFFRTFGIPILQGRGFRREDERSDSIAAIVNERVVRDCWPGENPLGRRIQIGADAPPGFQLPSRQGAGGGRPRLSGAVRVAEIVGVVKNVRDGVDMAARELPPIVYLPLREQDYGQAGLFGVTLVVRTVPGTDADALVRRQLELTSGRLTPYRSRTMQEQIDDILFTVRAAEWTYGFIGIFGLILAAVGLAGVTAYTVTQRRREIGIRMALGARRADVLRLVMQEGAMLISIGTILGLAGAHAGTRLLAAFIAQVARTAGMSASDPLLLAGAPLLLAAVALLACYLPARKSMRIDPAIALRQE